MKSESKIVPADPSQWSKESQQSVSAEWTTEYHDRHYTCRHCHADAVFTGEQQKYTYEIRKAHVSQQRTLCESCWRASNRIAKELAHYDEQWAAAKAELRHDVSFLEAWLDLHRQAGQYSAKEDIAKQRMIEKLLGR